MPNVAIFGGTFNPPHLGHKRLIEAFTKQHDFDKILIIPTFIPPHKTSPDLASCEDRLNMCKLAFKEPKFEVSDMEMKRGGKSYTYLTLTELKKRYINANLYLVVGSDMFLSFHEWKNPENIFEMCTVCAATRKDEIGLSDLYSYAKEKFPSQKDNMKIELIDFKPLEISSTKLRQMIGRDASVTSFVDESVLDYIYSRGLYNAGDGKEIQKDNRRETQTQKI